MHTRQARRRATASPARAATPAAAITLLRRPPAAASRATAAAVYARALCGRRRLRRRIAIQPIQLVQRVGPLRTVPPRFLLSPLPTLMPLSLILLPLLPLPPTRAALRAPASLRAGAATAPLHAAAAPATWRAAGWQQDQVPRDRRRRAKHAHPLARSHVPQPGLGMVGRAERGRWLCLCACGCGCVGWWLVSRHPRPGGRRRGQG